MANIIIMRGPSGSGKTTWARQFAKSHPNTKIVSADDYFTREGRYRFDARRLDRAHEACKVAYFKALMDDYHYVIVDNTNIRLWTFEVYEAGALAEDQVFAKTLGIHEDPEVLLKRCKHGLTLRAIERQIHNFEESHLTEWPGRE